jgi:hypothetical protein
MNQTKNQEQNKSVCPLDQKIKTVYDHLLISNQHINNCYDGIKRNQAVIENLISILKSKNVIDQKDILKIYGGKEE